jgi:hypothetical protein
MTLKRNRRRMKIGPGAWINLNKNGGYSSTTTKSGNQTFTQKRDGAIHTVNYGKWSDVTRSSYRAKRTKGSAGSGSLILTGLAIVGYAILHHFGLV